MNTKEPRYVDVKQEGEHYDMRSVYIPRRYGNTIRRIPYNSSVAQHIDGCIRKANSIKDPEEREEFLVGELEAMLG